MAAIKNLLSFKFTPETNNLATKISLIADIVNDPASIKALAGNQKAFNLFFTQFSEKNLDGFTQDVSYVKQILPQFVALFGKLQVENASIFDWFLEFLESANSGAKGTANFNILYNGLTLYLNLVLNLAESVNLEKSDLLVAALNNVVMFSSNAIPNFSLNNAKNNQKNFKISKILCNIIQTLPNSINFDLIDPARPSCLTAALGRDNLAVTLGKFKQEVERSDNSATASYKFQVINLFKEGLRSLFCLERAVF